MKYNNNGVTFKCNLKIPQEEAEAYIQRGLGKYGGELYKIEAEVDGDDIKLWYHTKQRIPFDRIRRITGYLVGTLDRFNDAKRAEEADRVKHDADV